MTKAIAMVSGGLDSILAAAHMKNLGYDVTAVNMLMPFGLESDRPTDADRMCKQVGLELRNENRGEAFFDLVRNPRFGYGKNMNPCIDCRIAMFLRAKQILQETGAQFIITGEVIGQRPMSQRRDAMNLIDREAEVRGLVLRPLCARHLPPIPAEENGLIDREKMLDFSGRSRKPQMRLARQMGIRDYPGPAGGCVLTDPIFGRKLKHLLEMKKTTTASDWTLLNVGRHLALGSRTKAIVSRNEAENVLLEDLAGADDAILIPVNFPGPTALIVGPHDSDARHFISGVILRYGKKPADATACVRILFSGNETELEIEDPADPDSIIPKQIL